MLAARQFTNSGTRFAVVASAVLAITAALGVPSASAAPGTLQRFDASVSPNKAGSKKQPASVGMNLRPYHANTLVTTQNGVLVGTGAFTEVPPFATRYATIWFPKQIRWQTSHFRRCPVQRVLDTPDRCPRGSEIGRTSSDNYALGALRSNPNGEIILAPRLSIRTFNVGSNQIAIRVLSNLTGGVVISGRLSTRMTASEKRNGFGSKLRIVVPLGLVSPAPSLVSQLSDFNTGLRRATTKYRGTTYRYAGLTSCPSTRKLKFAYRGEYNVGLARDAAGNYVINSSGPLVKTSSRCRR